MRLALNNWSQMELSNKFLSSLKDYFTEIYQGVTYHWEGSISKFDAILVSEECWRKITFNFGQVGPEIDFFCKRDMLTNQLMPDLDPIKINLSFFSTQQIGKSTKNRREKQGALSEISVLIST
jgi:hypothetical protein